MVNEDSREDSRQQREAMHGDRCRNEWRSLSTTHLHNSSPQLMLEGSELSLVQFLSSLESS